MIYINALVGVRERFLESALYIGSRIGLQKRCSFAKKLLLEGDVDRLEMRAGEGDLCLDCNNRNGNRNDGKVVVW